MVVGMKGNLRLEELSVATANGSNTLSVIASLKKGLELLLSGGRMASLV